jgi:dTDP-4-dehydrorhamnose reductase
MRVVVTGARGLLGAAIVREFVRDHEVHAFGHADLDVTDGAAVAALIQQKKPDVVINCAAYNYVDLAQEQPALALRVNGFAVQSMVRAAADARSVFVHYSSDFVFDGETDRPYTEEADPNPRGTYASSKLLGDWFALEYPDSYVLRVESLFGEPEHGGTRRGSLGVILDGLRRGEDVPVFVDRTVSPSYTADVAAATRALLTTDAPGGLYHCVNGGSGTWAAIATEAARLLGVTAKLTPITIESAGLKAPRPRYCALSNAKLERAGIHMPTWQEALARHIAETAADRSGLNVR